MTRVRMLAADERGLIGKILILWLALALLVVVLGYDAVQIGIARYRVADSAQKASSEAVKTLEATRSDREPRTGRRSPSSRTRAVCAWWASSSTRRRMRTR